MRIFFLLSLVFMSFSIKGQSADTGKVIGIHPAVGKLITRDEKIKYHLFTEYKDSVFENASIIKYNDSTFALSVSTVTGKELRTSITTSQLDDLYYRIEDTENGKKQKDDEYVLTEEERKEIRKKRARQDNSAFWYNFLAEMTIITFEVLISVASGL